MDIRFLKLIFFLLLVSTGQIRLIKVYLLYVIPDSYIIPILLEDWTIFINQLLYLKPMMRNCITYCIYYTLFKVDL